MILCCCFKQRTAYELRISDWSSDVCSSDLPRVEAITFDAHMEHLVQNAVGVIAMGGYNTFCEILSLNKRAVIVPRKRPRMEQFIRASRAQELGLVRMLEDNETYDPAEMEAANSNLPRPPLPSEVVIPGLRDGPDNVDRHPGRTAGRGKGGKNGV